MQDKAGIGLGLDADSDAMFDMLDEIERSKGKGFYYFVDQEEFMRKRRSSKTHQYRKVGLVVELRGFGVEILIQRGEIWV